PRSRHSRAIASTSSVRAWRPSGRGCRVIPAAPASRQVLAARTRSGSPPPRELRSSATLLRLTLSRVMATADGTEGAASGPGRGAVGFLGGHAAGFRLFAQAPQLVRIDHHRVVAG